MSEQLIFFILLFLSAFFSGAETAYTQIPAYKIRNWVEEGARGAKRIEKLFRDRDSLIITLLIGNNIVNIASSAIATHIALRIFGDVGVSIATGVMTLVILTFGEVTPKSIALRYAEPIVRGSSGIILFCKYLFWPLTWLLQHLPTLIKGILRTKESSTITEEQVKTIISMGEEEGTIKKIEKELIHNIFAFGDMEVKRVMTPRGDITTFDYEKKVNDILGVMLESGHSRFPVYEKELDSIKGVVYIKDILRYVAYEKNPPLKEVMRNVLFVPETKAIDSLLKQFQREKGRVAIVVDEHGVVMGIVTLTDLLEEIVGEIRDKEDEPAIPMKKINRNTFIVGGKTPIHDLNKKLKLGLPLSGEYDTIAGFMFKRMGKIPKNDESIIFRGSEFVVEEMDGKKIYLVKIIKNVRRESGDRYAKKESKL